MKTSVQSIGDIFGKDVQWIIPVYQREYEWRSREDKTERDPQVPRLWDDIKKKALARQDGEKPTPHYFGAIMYSPSNKSALESMKGVEEHYLVDGQQRITSSQLVLIALREVAAENDLLDMKQEVSEHILNDVEKEDGAFLDGCFKIWPSQTDRKIFHDMTAMGFREFRNAAYGQFSESTGKPVPQARKIIWAYWTLLDKIGGFVKEGKEERDVSPYDTLDSVLEAFLQEFRMVLIRLDEKEDDAQEIFASLNDLGEPLSPFDLVRNDVFLRARKEGLNTDALHRDHWSFFYGDEGFWSKTQGHRRGKISHKDHLINHVVAAETARTINASRVATEYRTYATERTAEGKFKSVKDEVTLLRNHAKSYRKLVEHFEYEKDESLQKIAELLDKARFTTFYPLMLWVLSQERGAVPAHEKVSIFNFVETYLVRRIVCDLSTKNYSTIVSSMISSMKKAGETGEGPLSALRAHVNDKMRGDSNKMPHDNQVKYAYEESVQKYHSGAWCYIFREIEYEKRGRFHQDSVVKVDDLEIEHVMPKKWAKHWPLSKVEGEDWERVARRRDELVNYPGNWTIVTKPLNASLSNSAWRDKRERLGESPLSLNREIASNENWGEEEIERRAKDLADFTCKRWPFKADGSLD